MDLALGILKIAAVFLAPCIAGGIGLVVGKIVLGVYGILKKERKDGRIH